MSGEVVRYALDAARKNALHAMKQIVCSGQDLQLIIFLVDSGGNLNLLAWTLDTRPPDAMELVVQACEDSHAVAALFVGEFNTDHTDGGFRVAGMHWCYPADTISESVFFIVDPDDGELQELEEHEIDIPDTLVEWLDEALLLV